MKIVILKIIGLIVLSASSLFAANEICLPYESGHTVYTRIGRATDKYLWNTTVSGWRPAKDANVTEYDIALTDANLGAYYGSVPVGISTAQDLVVRGYLQEGANPATTDLLIGNGEISWSGAAEITLSDVNSRITDSNDSQAATLGTIVTDANIAASYAKDANTNAYAAYTQAAAAAAEVNAVNIKVNNIEDINDTARRVRDMWLIDGGGFSN